MASKGGARAKGTDGNDYSHRETVAQRYQTSSKNKWRLKCAQLLHSLLFLIMLLKTTPEILTRFDISVGQALGLPRAIIWEWLWLPSILFLIPAYFGIRRNNVIAMEVYNVGTVGFGILPILCGLIYHSGDVRMYLIDNESIAKFQGIPIILLRCAFVALAFFAHSLSLMFSVNLIRSWTPSKKGKKKA